MGAECRELDCQFDPLRGKLVWKAWTDVTRLAEEDLSKFLYGKRQEHKSFDQNDSVGLLQQALERNDTFHEAL
jgi:hypothetical protein